MINKVLETNEEKSENSSKYTHIFEDGHETWMCKRETLLR